jgi:NAD(P)-dependent dehydrogenase (short-subunit alcohol dehydrogenase family)
MSKSIRRLNRSVLLASGVAAGCALAALRRTDRRRNMRGDVVLITGGSRGLGLALAREFGNAGCDIAICARDRPELDDAARYLASHGVTAYPVCCDVSNPAQVDELLRAVRARFGRIDKLINNAGVMRVGPLENMDIADFEQALNVMFWGTLYPTLAVLDEMKQRGSGNIVIIGSVGGKVSVPHLLPYCSAKFAVVGFGEGLRAEVAKFGVQVTTIVPGLMRTGSYRQAEFKGQAERESLWFGLGSTLPGVSMSAERAARQILTAVERGVPEKILTTQATLLARINGALPGVVPTALSMVNRLLPSGRPGRRLISGAQAEAGWSTGFRMLTSIGRRAARRLNEIRAPA